MPDARGRPLASEILPLLKDPLIANWLRSFLLQTASSESIGRYPGNGSAQNDNYVYPDAADATFPYNFDYEIPANFQRIISAKLSFRVRPYRTYSAFTLTATGGASQTHTHPHSSTHSHTWPIADGTGGTATLWQAGGGAGPVKDNSGITSNIATTAVSPGATDANTQDHTHTVSGSSVLGIAEDAAPVNPGITVSVDGVDVTAAIGGPFNGDMVEIDVTQVLKTSAKVWHTMSLQPNQRCRITGILRISYYTDSRVAQ